MLLLLNPAITIRTLSATEVTVEIGPVHVLQSPSELSLLSTHSPHRARLVCFSLHSPSELSLLSASAGRDPTRPFCARPAFTIRTLTALGPLGRLVHRTATNRLHSPSELSLLSAALVNNAATRTSRPTFTIRTLTALGRLTRGVPVQVHVPAFTIRTLTALSFDRRRLATDYMRLHSPSELSLLSARGA